jgi:hypothetical protein
MDEIEEQHDGEEDVSTQSLSQFQQQSEKVDAVPVLKPSDLASDELCIEFRRASFDETRFVAESVANSTADMLERLNK